MAPHLGRAQSTYKDVKKCSFYHTHACTHARTHACAHAHTRVHTHTHTLPDNTCITGDGLVE